MVMVSVAEMEMALESLVVAFAHSVRLSFS